MVDVIDTLRTLTRRLPDLKAGGDAAADASADVVDLLYDVYRARRAGIDDRTEATLTAFLEKSAPVIAPHLSRLQGEQIARMDDKIRTIWESDEWLTLCHLRSALSALAELYAPHIPEAENLADDEDLDEDIRFKAETEAYLPPGAVPANMPDSHWWWTLG